MPINSIFSPFLKTISSRILLVVFLTVSCSQDDNSLPTVPGTIQFTSSHDCEFRLFDSDGRQLVREFYRPGSVTVVRMKTTGIFILHAVSASKTIKVPISYIGGNKEYFIEF